MMVFQKVVQADAFVQQSPALSAFLQIPEVFLQESDTGISREVASLERLEDPKETLSSTLPSEVWLNKRRIVGNIKSR